jgi:hypothetical protein
VPDWVEVGCYAGGRGDEAPRVVLLGGCEVMVQVERRWIDAPVGSTGGERRRMFKVRLEDGRRGRLAQEPDGSWTLAQPADGVVNDPSRVCAEGLADGRAWSAV